MRSILTALVLLAVCGALLDPPRARAETLTLPPPLDIHDRTLPNGLRLYTVLDPTASNVTVQVWYGVGAKDDPVGRSGFAHLFEHLMFKATRDMPADYLTRLTDDVGGMNNATTDNDYTQFYDVAPAGRLEPLLWAEAERMSSLVVDQAGFIAERAVVEDELRQRVLSDPYGRLLAFDVPAASFAVHPYRRSPIGSVADLQAATLDDVRAFHALYYRPDNASVVVVGKYDPAQLNRWVDKYFGAIARPTTAIPRVAVREPPRTGPQFYDSVGPQAPLPALAITFVGPDAASPDAVALDVLDAILTTGKSSRLNARLVYGKQLAAEVFSDSDLRQQGGLIDVGATLNAGVSLEAGETALRAELADLRDHPVSEAELRTAKNQLLAAMLEDRETLEGVATEIGEAAVLQGDAQRANTDVAALNTVTAADVQRVAQTYLVDDRRVTVHYHAAGWRPTRAAHLLPTEPAPPVRSSLPATTVAEVAPALPLPEGRTDASPAPPIPVERTLPNGLRVIVARTGAVPLATAYLAVRGGSALDPADQAGLTELTTSLAAHTGGGRSATQIAAASEALGDVLTNSTDYDSSSFSLTGLSASLPDGLAILRDAARDPSLDASELRRLRREMADTAWASMRDPDEVTDFALAPLVFGQGPYGHAGSGLPKSLAHIDRADVARQYARLFRPDNAVLVLTGDLDPDAAFAMAEHAFGDWVRPASAPPSIATGAFSLPAPSASRTIAIDAPGADEATVTIAARSIGRLDADYYAVEVANAVLGGGYAARLNNEIRVKRALTYDAGSTVEALQGAGIFSATVQTRNVSAAEVAGLLLDQLKALRTAPPAPDELAARKAALIGDFEQHAHDSADMAELLADNAVHGLSAADFVGYPARIEAVTAGQAQAAAALLADPARTDVLVVGDSKAFLPAMKARFGTVEVLREDAVGSLGRR